MNFKLIFIFNCLSMISCVENPPKVERDDKLNTDSNLTKGLDSQIINSKISGELSNGNHLTDDPDTSLAKFLFDEFGDINFEDNFTELVRWELEHDKIKDVINSLYSDNSNYRFVLDSLEKYRASFIEYNRNMLFEDYEKLRTLTGPPLDFLYSIKDSAAVDLMKRALKNKSLSEDEREEIISKLKDGN